MRRGVIRLTKEELEYVLQVIKDNQDCAALVHGIQLALKEEGAERLLQVTEQSVEAVLDIFGMPAEGEDAMLETLRTKFRNTLATLG